MRFTCKDENLLKCYSELAPRIGFSPKAGQYSIHQKGWSVVL